MPTACINHVGARIHLKSERLEIISTPENGRAEEVLREIPIRDLDRLIIAESVQITSPAMAALLRSGIPIAFLGWNGDFLGGFLPAQTHDGLTRLRQYRRTSDPQFAREMAGRIIAAKIYNQRRVVQRLLHRTEQTPPPDDPDAPSRRSLTTEQVADIRHTLAWMDNLLAAMARAQSIDEIRGYEGASTGRYFLAWAAFLPAEFPFERRSTRPPLNPVNACISFGATLIYQEMVSFIHAHGLDPALGLLHATEDGRWSLALDLIEPFRPALIEALALDLFSHEMLNHRHFRTATVEPRPSGSDREPRPLGSDKERERSGGVYLNDEGRKKFLLQYERRMERQFISECAGHRTTLRQQLEAQATMYKTALENPEKFEPFLIN